MPRDPRAPARAKDDSLRYMAGTSSRHGRATATCASGRSRRGRHVGDLSRLNGEATLQTRMDRRGWGLGGRTFTCTSRSVRAPLTALQAFALILAFAGTTSVTDVLTPAISPTDRPDSSNHHPPVTRALRIRQLNRCAPARLADRLVTVSPPFVLSVTVNRRRQRRGLRALCDPCGSGATSSTTNRPTASSCNNEKFVHAGRSLTRRTRDRRANPA
jgi:hypothetical protein